MSDAFRLGFVPGVTPATWARTWEQRHPDVELRLEPVPAADAEGLLAAGEVDAALLRPPVDREVMHAIVVYEEVPVVAFSRDHVLAVLEPQEQVSLADLAEEIVLWPLDDVLPWGDAAPPGRPALERPATTTDAVALVAAGVGVALMPMSLARLHHRKDVLYRQLAQGPPAPVALAWVVEREDERIEDLVGIVRGRTVNSSRGRRAGAGESRQGQAGRQDGGAGGRAGERTTGGRQGGDAKQGRPQRARGRSGRSGMSSRPGRRSSRRRRRR